MKCQNFVLLRQDTGGGRGPTFLAYCLLISGKQSVLHHAETVFRPRSFLFDDGLDFSGLRHELWVAIQSNSEPASEMASEITSKMISKIQNQYCPKGVFQYCSNNPYSISFQKKFQNDFP